MKSIPIQQRTQLIQYNEKPFRLVLTKQQRQINLKNRHDEDELFRKERSINYECPLCKSGYSETIICYSSGHLVCVQCGYVPNEMPIFQELTPFLWKSVNINNSDSSWNVNNRLSNNDSKYSRYFHFNEILAAINLQGPRIPNLDMRLIRTEIQRTGINTVDKSRIQAVQRAIDKKYSVRRFSRRYGEKWIQIAYRVFGERPSKMDDSFQDEMKNLFKLLVATWPQVKHLIKGSKKDGNRWQWPNYTVTVYELIKRCFPQDYESYKSWLPLLSEKKLKELSPCFNAMFYLTGLNK